MVGDVIVAGGHRVLDRARRLPDRRARLRLRQPFPDRVRRRGLGRGWPSDCGTRSRRRAAGGPRTRNRSAARRSATDRSAVGTVRQQRAQRMRPFGPLRPRRGRSWRIDRSGPGSESSRTGRFSVGRSPERAAAAASRSGVIRPDGAVRRQDAGGAAAAALGLGAGPLRRPVGGSSVAQQGFQAHGAARHLAAPAVVAALDVEVSRRANCADARVARGRRRRAIGERVETRNDRRRRHDDAGRHATGPWRWPVRRSPGATSTGNAPAARSGC